MTELVTTNTNVSNSAERLNREDWIDEAWRILGKGNMNEVKVNILAKNLCVTRGSFYWHFKNREDLIEALLDRWFTILGLRESIEPQLLDSESAEQSLFLIFQRVIESISGGQSIALRLQAKDDAKLRRRIKEEDRRRLAHFANLFVKIGASESRADELGKLYQAVVVSEYLRNGGSAKSDRIASAREFHDALVSSIRT